jgi:uncharacterized protein (UPF0548 family)
VFSLRSPSPQILTRLVREQSGRELTYPEVGATAGEMPAGYRHDRWELDLGGLDAARFAHAAGALRTWEVQRRSGLAIFPGDPVQLDRTFVIVVRLPGCFLTAAGRIVRITDEPGHYGFAYGTLPAHAEQGEETFDVLRQDDRMIFRIVAFSRPRHPAARLGSPVTRHFQLRTTRGYLAAMREAIGA